MGHRHPCMDCVHFRIWQGVYYCARQGDALLAQVSSVPRIVSLDTWCTFRQERDDPAGDVTLTVTEEGEG